MEQAGVHCEKASVAHLPSNPDYQGWSNMCLLPSG